MIETSFFNTVIAVTFRNTKLGNQISTWLARDSDHAQELLENLRAMQHIEIIAATDAIVK